MRVYGQLADEDGAGFNHILVRKGTDDIYGEWQVCKIGRSVVVPRESPSRPEPFGFESEREFRKDMQYSEGIAHVYTYRFEPACPLQFLQVAIEFMRRRRGKRPTVR